MRSCTAKLKPGAPFLVYLYYAFGNRPLWFRLLWKSTDAVRRLVSHSPHGLRYALSQVIAAAVYWPLARTARLLERLGRNVESFPLSFYRHHSFYVMRTDALDRFGTRLEQRFTREQIRGMMEEMPAWRASPSARAHLTGAPSPTAARKVEERRQRT